MILDKLNEFASAVSVAAAAGTALIGDVIDLQDLRDIGNGQPVYLAIFANTEIITGGSAGTISFSLASDAQAAIATDGSATVHLKTKDFVTGAAGANDPLLGPNKLVGVWALPLEGPSYERYLGLLATIGTTTVSAGSISAGLTLDPTGWKPYADAVN